VVLESVLRRNVGGIRNSIEQVARVAGAAGRSLRYRIGLVETAFQAGCLARVPIRTIWRRRPLWALNHDGVFFEEETTWWEREDGWGRRWQRLDNLKVEHQR
jgi:hypothetical protein